MINTEELANKCLGFKALQMRKELIWLINNLKSLDSKKLAVELGVASGGTLYALYCLFDKIVGVDTGKKELPYTLRENDEYIIGSTKNEDIINGVPNDIDFLLIDADHRYEGVSGDFDLWKHKVRKGGIIAFHDIQGAIINGETNHDVKNLWNEIKNSGKYETKELSVHPKHFGIGLIFT